MRCRLNPFSKGEIVPSRHALQTAKMILGTFALLVCTVSSGQLLCNRGYNCGPCNGGQAYARTGTSCVACFGICQWYSPGEKESDLAPAASNATFVPLEGGLYLGIEFTASQLYEIAARNLWAANAMLDLRSLEGQVDLSHGYLTLIGLPTRATIALADMPIRRVEDVSTTVLPLEPGIDARVSWVLSRDAYRDAELRLSSYVADEVGRILYKPYPDVVVSFADIQNAPEAAQDKRQLSEGTRTRLVARSWIVAD